MVDVTIAIVNWNTCTLLEQCVRSLADGVKGISAKIMVIDNASADGSAERMRIRFPEVHLIANTVNLGFAYGNNQAYAMAEGRYFLLLNPDTVVRPGAIASMVQFLDETPAAAGVTCKLVNPDGSFQRIFTRLPTWRYVLAVHTVCRAFWPDSRLVREFYMEDESFDRVTAVEQPSASCLMIRRDLFPGLVLFDERFPILFNDTDLYRRMHDRGMRLYFSPDGEVMHIRGGGGVGQMGDHGIIDYLICLIRYYRKHDGFLAAAVLWWVLALSSVVSLGGRTIKMLLGVKPMNLLRHEWSRQLRMILCRERFTYPPEIKPLVPNAITFQKGLA